MNILCKYEKLLEKRIFYFFFPYSKGDFPETLYELAMTQSADAVSMPTRQRNLWTNKEYYSVYLFFIKLKHTFMCNPMAIFTTQNKKLANFYFIFLIPFVWKMHPFLTYLQYIGLHCASNISKFFLVSFPFFIIIFVFFLDFCAWYFILFPLEISLFFFVNLNCPLFFKMKRPGKELKRLNNSNRFNKNITLCFKDVVRPRRLCIDRGTENPPRRLSFQTDLLEDHSKSRQSRTQEYINILSRIFWMHLKLYHKVCRLQKAAKVQISCYLF